MNGAEPSRASRAVFGCAGADRPPEVVLLLRLIAIAWILTGHALLLGTRSVPFFEVLRPLGASPVLAWAELIVGAVCAAQLVLRRSVGASALTLGCLVFVTTLLSRAYFSNNRLYTACVLVMAGLAASKGPPYLLRAQVVLLYLAAGLDKLLDADWRSGAFLRSLAAGLGAHGRLWSPGADTHTAYLPTQLAARLLDSSPWLAVVASWTLIALELGVGVAFAVQRPRTAIGLGLGLHVGLLLYTGSPMGMFFYTAAAAYLAFVRLPTALEVRVGPRAYAFARAVLSAVDADRQCRVALGRELSVTCAGVQSSGTRALFALLAALPAYYVGAAVVLAGPWFTPWSVLILSPLAFAPWPASPRAEVREVTGELNP